MKIIVSGSSGFIGSEVANLYALRGYEVIGLDTATSSYLNPSIKQYIINLEKESIPNHILKDTHIINHLAAQVDVRRSIENPLADLTMNVGSTLRLLEQAKKAHVKKFIFSSSGGAIADSEQPQSPYGISKLTAEKYIKFYHEQHKLEYTILRYSNVYGPLQRAGVIPIFVFKLLRNLPIEINGGVQQRDFIFIDDIAEINTLAMNLPSNTYTICSGSNISILDLAHLLKQLTNSSSEIIYKDQIKGEVMISELTQSDFLKTLTITSLEQGLKKVVESLSATLLF